MAISGKYDFKGIKKYGAAGLRVAFASSPYTAWINRLPAVNSFILELSDRIRVFDWFL